MRTFMSIVNYESEKKKEERRKKKEEERGVQSAFKVHNPVISSKVSSAL